MMVVSDTNFKTPATRSNKGLFGAFLDRKWWEAGAVRGREPVHTYVVDRLEEADPPGCRGWEGVSFIGDLGCTFTIEKKHSDTYLLALSPERTVLR